MPPVVPNVTGQQVAQDALRYKGYGYVYGGDASRPGNWDCSSFVSYVLGHDLNLALPGGKWGDPGFPPNAHGPVVTSYASWSGARTVPGPPQAGDLCCFVGTGASGHIGIAIDGSHMVSALDTIDGTLVTPIQGYGPAGAPLIYRRLLGVPGGGTLPSAGSGGAGAAAVGVLVALGLVAAMAAAIVGGAVLVGAAVAAGGAWAVEKAAKG